MAAKEISVKRYVVRLSADERGQLEALCQTGFVTLDRLLARLHANKGELLRVLDQPEVPLHANGSENDIRCQVIKRNISRGAADLDLCSHAGE